MMIKERMREKIITDLALSSYLSCAGHKLLSVKQKGKKSAFTFEESEILERDILAFYNRTARVDPLTFAEIFRNLKALIWGS